MKKWQKRIVSVLAVLVMALGVSFPAVAVSEEEIELTTTVSASEPVTVTYTYSIAPNSNNQPGATNEPTAVTVAFDDAVPGASGSVEDKATISFAAADYVNTGIYRYIVTEADSSNPAYPASGEQFEIYVQVIEDAGIMKKTVYDQALNLQTNTKGEIEFNHGERLTYIYVENYAQGLITDIGTVFKYRLEILGPVGARYTVKGQDATVNYEGEGTVTTATEYEVKDGEDNYLNVYLKDGQTLTVGLADDGSYQIPVGTRFRLIKEKVNKWYTTINDQHFSTEQDMMDFMIAGVDPLLNKIVVENLRDFDVPLTGVILNALPFLVLVGLAVLGISLIKKVTADEKRAQKKSARKSHRRRG